MWEQILPGLRIKIFMTVVLGVVYPLLMTGISQVIFPKQANGSLITVGDKVVGSEIIGQGSTKPEYFQPRPSAAKASIDQFHKDNPDYHGPIPADLVTASASGLDPHVSPASALAEAPRVAKARAVSTDQVNPLIGQFTEGPDLGLLGEPRVNGLLLNLALDQRFAKRVVKQ